MSHYNPRKKYDRYAIYERDGGICQVCGRKIAVLERVYDISELQFYECGHIVDHVCGGTETEDNLVCMCMICNRWKPLHETKQEYLEWLKNGYWVTDFLKFLKETHNTDYPEIDPERIRWLILEGATKCFVERHFSAEWE